MEESLSELFAEEIYKLCFQYTVGKMDRALGSDKNEAERGLLRCYNLFKKSNDVTTKTFKIIASLKKKEEN
jgi:hypothetical protein